MGELYTFLEKGGVLMFPILAASLAAITIFIEKLITLRRRVIVPQGLFQTLSQLLGTKNFEQAESICARSPGSLSRLAGEVLKRRNLPKEQAKQALEEVGQREVKHLEARVEVMGIVATIAPLLGLLGTVTGMIQVFRDVSSQGGDPKVEMLAGGIWEALITTATGLTVAIISYLCYRIVQAKISDLMREMEEKTALFVELTYGDIQIKEHNNGEFQSKEG